MRLDYGFKVRVGVSGALGGSPYGATTIADVDGSRTPKTFAFVDFVRRKAKDLTNRSSQPLAGPNSPFDL